MFFAIPLLFATFLIQGVNPKDPVTDSPPPPKVRQNWPLLEFKASYFFFSDAKMRKVYDQGGLDLQLTSSYPLWEWLHLYGSVEYLMRHGKTLNMLQKTSIWEIPLSLGLQPVVTIFSKVQYYFTLGPRYTFVHAHNNPTFLDRTTTQSGFGGFVNTGFYFLPYRHLLFDIFGEYSYSQMHFHPSREGVYGRDIQVGGFAFGAGLGYAF